MVRTPAAPAFGAILGFVALLSGTAALATGADGAWSELPPPIGREAVIYDPPRQRLILLGGQSDDNPAGVWVTPTGGTPQWTFVLTSGARPPLGNVCAVYDSLRDRVVLFGLDWTNVSQNVVWTLSLATMTWAPLSPSGAAPSWRTGQMAISDPTRDRMILFGGGQGGGMLTGPQYNDVWALSFAGTPTWTQLQPAGTPPMGRQFAACVLDRARDRMLIFAGAPDYSLTNYTDLNDVWALSLAGPTWTQLQPAGTPPPTMNAPVAILDAPRDRLVVGGGSSATTGSVHQTWSLDLGSLQWSQLLSTGRIGAAAYDVPNDRLLCSDGAGNLNALALSSPAWSLLLQGAGWLPGAEYSFALTSDPDRGQALLTGGLCDCSDFWPYFNDYYVNDYWTTTGIWHTPLDHSIPFASRPGLRADHVAVLDRARARLLLLGGFEDNGGQGTFGNDVWAMSLTPSIGWTHLTPSGTPPTGRGGASAVVDAANDRVVIFGGIDGTQALNDVWQLGLPGPQWSPITASGTPPPARQRAAAVYDAAGQRMILFGGLNVSRENRAASYQSFNDLWSLDLSGTPSWTQLAPLGTPPPPTTDPIAVPNPDRSRIEILTDAGVWELALTDPPQWTALDIAGAVLGTLARGAAVYDSVRHRIVAMPANTDGAWELDLIPAVTTSVPPPRASVALALRAVPNPAAGVRLVVSLPGDGPARLDVLDVTGRVVAGREVGMLGAGTHVVSVTPPGSLPPGIYFARLTRGESTITRRLAVLR